MKQALIVTILLIAIAWVPHGHVFAADLGSQINSQVQAGAQSATFGEAKPPQIVIAEMIQVLLTLVGSIMIVLVVFSGYMMLSARGDEQRYEKGMKTLRGAAVGLVIVLISYSITKFVAGTVFQASNGSNLPAGGSGIEVQCNGFDCERRAIQ